MADLCVECERLWKEYSAALHEYLGLNPGSDAAASFGNFYQRHQAPVDPRSLAALKEKILRHEGDRHPDAS